MRLAPDDSMAATAVLNTGGNLGGVCGDPRDRGTFGGPSMAGDLRAWRGGIRRRGRCGSGSTSRAPCAIAGGES